MILAYRECRNHIRIDIALTGSYCSRRVVLEELFNGWCAALKLDRSLLISTLMLASGGCEMVNYLDRRGFLCSDRGYGTVCPTRKRASLIVEFVLRHFQSHVLQFSTQPYCFIIIIIVLQANGERLDWFTVHGS